MRTVSDIQTELTAVNAAILSLIANKGKGVTFQSVGNRQISFSGRADLDVLRELRRELELELTRAERGGGIRVRYGVSIP